MKKKDLIQLIKSKASDIEINDLSEKIINQVKSMPEKEVVLPPNNQFRPRLVFAASLAVILTVVLTIIFMLPDKTKENLQPQFEDVDSVLMFSSISTAALLEDSDASNISTLMQPLAYTFNAQANSQIYIELNHMTKYFELMEQLFASQANFNKKIETPQAGYEQSMHFKSKDFLEEETDFRIDYLKTPVDETNNFNILGQINVGSKIYNFNGNGHTNADNLLAISIHKDNASYIDTTYEMVDQKHVFNFVTNKQNIVVEDVTLIIEKNEDKNLVELRFNQEQGFGTYNFELALESNVRVLKVNYNLENEMTEKGEMMIKVRKINGQNTYSILVKPDNGKPFQVNQNKRSNGRFK